jgi:hypothetical protein
MGNEWESNKKSFVANCITNPSITTHHTSCFRGSRFELRKIHHLKFAAPPDGSAPVLVCWPSWCAQSCAVRKCVDFLPREMIQKAPACWPDLLGVARGWSSSEFRASEYHQTRATIKIGYQISSASIGPAVFGHSIRLIHRLHYSCSNPLFQFQRLDY